MNKFVIGLAVLAMISASPSVAATGRAEASMDEAHAATRTSEVVGMVQYCGFGGILGNIPAQLTAFEQTHTSNGRPLISDMAMDVEMSTRATIAKAGSKERFCGQMAAHKAETAGLVQQNWANVQALHAKAKTAGH